MAARAVFDIIPPSKSHQRPYFGNESKFAEDHAEPQRSYAPLPSWNAADLFGGRDRALSDYTTFLPSHTAMPQRLQSSGLSSGGQASGGGGGGRHLHSDPLLYANGAAVARRFPPLRKLPDVRRAPLCDDQGEKEFLPRSPTVAKSLRGWGFHAVCFVVFALLMITFHVCISGDPHRSQEYSMHMLFVAVPSLLMIQELYNMC